MSLDMIPTYYPFEDILEAQDKIDEEFTVSVRQGDPFNIYAPGSPHFIDTTDYETDTLAYDIEQENPQDMLQTTFIQTSCDESQFALLQPNEKVKKTWYNHLTKFDNKVDPLYALDQPCFRFQSTIQKLESNAIQATHLYTPTDDDTLSFPLGENLTTTCHLPDGLPIQVLIDTGSHKNIMNKLFFKKHASHFQNFAVLPITTPPHIKTPTGQTVTIEGMIALPIYLQGNLFQLHILLATFSDQYKLILGIEALIQLEATLFLTDSTLQVTR